jgi:hypothetical protein
MVCYRLNELFGFWVWREIKEVVVFNVRSDSSKISHGFGDNSGHVCSAKEVKIVFDHAFQLYLQMNQVVVAIGTIRDGLYVMPVTASSIGMTSAAVVLVSDPLLGEGERKTSGFRWCASNRRCYG